MKIVLATGGTGGHIYPAIALAKYIRENSDDEILFVGTTNHMEYDIVNKNDFEFYGYNLDSGSRSLFHKGMQMIQLVAATSKMYFHFRKNRPDVVVGFGSYISFPPLLAAKFLRIPIVLHEQNSSTGKANLMFFDDAQYLISCYESVDQELNSPKVLRLGNPRASEVANIQKDEAVLKEFGLDPKRKTVLIVMGSLGSSSINDIMFNSLQQVSILDLQIIFVTGQQHYDVYKDNLDIDNVKVVPFIDQPHVMKNVDLVIARGGATTAAEICALGTPSIIIPSPYVANNHQYINALELKKVGAGVIIKEEDLNEEVLIENIQDILFDDEKLYSMHQAALSLAYPDAITDIMNVIKEFARED